MAGVPMAMNQSCFAFAGIGIPQTVVFQIIKRAVYSLKTKAIGAVFAAINTRDLKLEEVDIPKSSVMADYDAFARPIHALIKANEEEALRLAELRGALLPKLMSGEIDVSEVDLTQLNSHLVHSPLRSIHTVHVVVNERDSYGNRHQRRTRRDASRSQTAPAQTPGQYAQASPWPQAARVEPRPPRPLPHSQRGRGLLA